MNNPESKIQNPKSKIVIAGAGPAGSSLAIRLAKLGFETTLIERERFPRAKLCGEFISPESFEHFDELGVLDAMLSAGGDQITETRFFESGGRSVVVPSSWFGRGEFALGLSRAEMDHILMKRAIELGVSVHEGTNITGLDIESDTIVSLSARMHDGETRHFGGDVFIDATGRQRVIGKMAERKLDVPSPHIRPELVGFKTHLESADLEKGVCEIYSFPGGYAGLSRVENDKFNLCFLLKSGTVRSAEGDVDEIVQNIVRRNKRAAVTLRNNMSHDGWLAVSVDGFGTRKRSPARNLFTVGDAASFIDPFTGSGMYMAFQSAGALASAIGEFDDSPEQIAGSYSRAHKRLFSTRHRVCWVLRQTAFMPTVATAIVSGLSLSSGVRRRLARATRR